MADRTNHYSVLFVGHLYPKNLEPIMLAQPFPPVQTQRFGESLMLALIEGFGETIEGFSVAPLQDYPKSMFLIAPGAKWLFGQSILITMAPFINVMGLKHLTRFLATFLFVLKWGIRHKSSTRIIVMHGVQSCKLWGVLFASFILPAFTFSFLTDDLGIPLNNEGWFSRTMRYIDVLLMRKGLQRVSGILAMTQPLVDKWAFGKPALIVPAIMNPYGQSILTNLSENYVVKKRTVTIGYFGGLYESYGVGLLLDTFKLFNQKDWHLIIAGSGNMEERVKAAAVQDPRIKYLGYLSSEELGKVYRDVDILVNPRLTSVSIASLAFPSKLVEYMSTGKPVITTNLPVLDEDFRRHLIIAESDTPESLGHCIEIVASWSEAELKLWRIRALNFVQKTLSPEIQGKKIRHFIDFIVNSR